MREQKSGGEPWEFSVWGARPFTTRRHVGRLGRLGRLHPVVRAPRGKARGFGSGGAAGGFSVHGCSFCPRSPGVHDNPAGDLP
ncbi:MAG: hypothetical protein ACK5PF_02140 [bacterium]